MALLVVVNGLQTLVGSWMSIPEVADAIGVRQRDVRAMIDDGQLLAHRIGPNDALSIPAAFVREGQILPALLGTITVLADAGLSSEESLTWLFTPDETLPVVGSPMTMLQLGRKAEVRKRASELAW
ncbi:helix-turn-helix domain-containing protein [Calidifontibacter sp. DB0510]|uniref:Helix-turn-helix domain-containing protein n=1 Tax=Metallococcus carri TaxID=1656884 RepID=A0A967EB26_9MICO|nr:Rv2175c family DNA-binding protein [Metallococcus carri]NHN56865.1 helix-turn-helix domain-containing protein [Metallococcus carri]NOP37610.1 DNA-binding protein [Calidifontibacter sp. DB2511S]